MLGGRIVRVEGVSPEIASRRVSPKKVAMRGTWPDTDVSRLSGIAVLDVVRSDRIVAALS